MMERIRDLKFPQSARCVNCFILAMVKYHDQKQLKERVSFILWLQRDRVPTDGEEMVPGARSNEITSHLHVEIQRENRKWGEATNPQCPLLSDVLPLARLSLPKILYHP